LNLGNSLKVKTSIILATLCTPVSFFSFPRASVPFPQRWRVGTRRNQYITNWCA